jgi:myo-inositol-1(or 4)-monophosphatase
MITEAGGLVGNFTGESDFLYQREIVAGNPKVYGQMVQILAPYTRVIKEDAPAEGPLSAVAAGLAAQPDATQAFVAGTGVEAAPPAAPVKKAPVRIRRATPTGEGEDAPM